MSNIEIRVYSPALELKGIIDEFSSLIWIRRYQAAGEFEIHTPYSEENRMLLVQENIVQKFDGLPTTEAGVIESIDMDSDEMIIKGRFLESYLNRRLIKETEYHSGRAELSMRAIVSDMVSFPLIELGTDSGSTETLEFQATYKKVQKIIEKVCTKTTLGYRIRPDFQTRRLYFEIYKGNEPGVVFSEKYDNIFNERYQFDSTELGTKCYVWQIINDVRTVYVVGSGSGRDLLEFSYQTSVDTDGRTAAQIKESMEHQGELAIAQNAIRESFTFSTDSESAFRYRDDYDIGDVVQIKHVAWGISLPLRLTEIEEDYDSEGKNIVLTCGSALPEVADFNEED